jgi:hypothetical protein
VKKSAAAPVKRALHYKVVELSNVDEGSLERTVNEWSAQGWTFDGVQFAMRESSKRPSMGFVFFTREGSELPAPVEYGVDAFRTDHEAHDHLKRLARNEAPVPQPASTDAWSRLQALADDEGDL